MRRAACAVLILLSIVLLSAAGGAPTAQTPAGDPNAPGVDMNGPYDPVPNWYKPIHPGTLQCGSGVAAETPNRIYVVTEVEVPANHQGACTPERYKPGAHSHNILVLDSNGTVVEDWKQWDNLFGYGHAIRLNPYDPAHLWIVNRDVHQVQEFTRDGKQLVMTLGWALRHPGNDERHFNMPSDIAFPHMVVAQADGCAPIVRAFAAGETKAIPWENPTTHASGLRVPGPLGDRLILRALRESNGEAHAVSEDAIREGTLKLSRASGVDAAPEGGCALAVTEQLLAAGRIPRDAEVLVFNTGSGASYRL